MHETNTILYVTDIPLVAYNGCHRLSFLTCISFPTFLKIVCKTSEEKNENHGSVESVKSLHVTGSNSYGHKTNIIITNQLCHAHKIFMLL